MKAINTKSADSYQEVEPLIVEELVVFPPSSIVTSLRIVTAQQRKKLIVVSSSSVVAISLHRCGTKKITTCRCATCSVANNQVWISLEGQTESYHPSALRHVTSVRRQASTPPQGGRKKIYSSPSGHLATPIFVSSSHLIILSI